MGRSCFISLDGVDGAGKSTQCRLLADWLRRRGHTVILCNDPGGTPLGDRLREILLQQRQDICLISETLLFMASRAQLVATVIRPALEAGHVVLSDRFLLANVVYQGHAGGLDPAHLWQIGLLATQGIEPDQTVVLDVPLNLARGRRNRPADRMESRGDDFHARVREGFLTEARRRPDRISVIDATSGQDEVHEAICQEVSKLGI